MASILDLGSLTLNPQEALAASEAIFELLFAKPELNDAHLVATGIQMQTQIPIYGQFGLVGQQSAGTCTANEESGQIKASEKYWIPKLIDMRFPHCQEQIDQLFKMWKRSNSGLMTWEEIESEQEAFVLSRVMDATLQSILRISSFGDTDEDEVGSGGNLTVGTTLAYFTMLDGLWPQIITAVTALTLTARVNITNNAAPTYTAQDDLADDAALKIMRSMYEQIDVRARTELDLKFQITDSLFRNWQTFLENKSLAFTLQTTEERKSTDGWTYRGIPIVVRMDWDRIIRTYFDTGTAWYLPHRAILTPLNNIPIGTSNESDFQNFKMFYDEYRKYHYTDVAYYIDCKLLEEYAIAVAY